METPHARICHICAKNFLAADGTCHSCHPVMAHDPDLATIRTLNNEVADLEAALQQARPLLQAIADAPVFLDHDQLYSLLLSFPTLEQAVAWQDRVQRVLARIDETQQEAAHG